jgi:hypothetical protein
MATAKSAKEQTFLYFLQIYLNFARFVNLKRFLKKGIRIAKRRAQRRPR